MRFRSKPPSFAAVAARGRGLPAAHRAQARRRYAAMLREVKDVLPVLPAPGESLHALMTGLYDFMSVVGLVIARQDSPCTTLRIATLAFSLRNVTELESLAEKGMLVRTRILTSDFFAKHNRGIVDEARRLLVPRGGCLAAPRCHAKVACLEFADSTRYVFEGSANLRTNRNVEQFALFNDAGLHDWHAGWIEDLIAKWSREQEGKGGASE